MARDKTTVHRGWAGFLPPALFVMIGIVLHETHGMYDVNYLFPMLGFLAACVWAMYRAVLGPEPSPENNTLLLRLSALSLVIFLFLLVQDHDLMYPQKESSLLPLFQNGLLGAFLGTIFGLFQTLANYSEKRERTMTKLFLALAVLLWVMRFLVLKISPTPFIDVWVCNNAAADFLAKGLNPYSQSYPDIYGGRSIYKPAFGYFPGVLVYFSPFRWIFGDVRFGSIFGEGASAVLIFWLAKRMQLPRSVGAALSALWLAFPVGFFVLEQAWVDTALVAIVTATILALDYRKWFIAAAVAGFAFSFKQYGIFVPALASLYVWRQAGMKNFLAFCAIAVGVSALVILPFALKDWTGFHAMTIAGIQAFKVRTDALSLSAWLAREYEFIVTDFMTMGITLLAIGASAYGLFKSGKSRLADLCAALVLVYGTLFSFGKLAFCNYYYFLAASVLLFILLDHDRRQDHVTI